MWESWETRVATVAGSGALCLMPYALLPVGVSCPCAPRPSAVCCGNAETGGDRWGSGEDPGSRDPGMQNAARRPRARGQNAIECRRIDEEALDVCAYVVAFQCRVFVSLQRLIFILVGSKR